MNYYFNKKILRFFVHIYLCMYKLIILKRQRLDKHKEININLDN